MDDEKKKNTYYSLYTYTEFLTNLLNAKRQELTITVADIRFLELLFKDDPKRTVIDDDGRPVTTVRRMDELKVGVINIKVRIQALKELLTLSKEEGKFEETFNDEALKPSPEILEPEALKDVKKEGEQGKENQGEKA